MKLFQSYLEGGEILATVFFLNQFDFYFSVRRKKKTVRPGESTLKNFVFEKC